MRAKLLILARSAGPSRPMELRDILEHSVDTDSDPAVAAPLPVQGYMGMRQV